MSLNRVYILILNWNGWGDTIECLESVFRLDYPDFRVIVCDNASGNGSMEKIQAWIEGRLDVYVPATHQLRELSFPPVPKPRGYVLYDRSEAEAGGDKSNSSDLILIQTGTNLGFAGGNNVGLRYVLARDDFDFVWLLNNDTVVKPDALSWMVKRMEERTDAGMCGSLLPFYYRPDRIWAQGGGYYDFWLAKPVACVGFNLPFTEKLTTEKVETQMNYLAGASMLVGNKFLISVGLMSEDYFLYFEEIDWAMRARNRFKLCYAEKSIVYHKVGSSIANYDNLASIASNSKAINMKNEILFAYRFFPVCLPFVIIRLFFRIAAVVANKFIRNIKPSGVLHDRRSTIG